MQYNPKVFEGEHAQEIFSEVIHRNNTVEKNLVRVMDDIKNKTIVTSIEGEIPFGAYKEDLRESDLANYSDSVKFGDAEIQPVKLMAFTTFKMDELRNSRFASDMAAGAANITSNEFEQAVLGHCIPRLSKSYERAFWNSITAATKAAIAADSEISAKAKAWAAAQTAGQVDGIIARMVASKAVIEGSGTANTVEALAAEYGKLFALIPAELFEQTDLVIYAPHADKQKILQANANQTYRDIFTVAGESFAYLGVKIEFVPIPNSIKIAGRGGSNGDFIWATDLLSDITSFEVNKVNNAGDEIFMKQVAVLDTAIVVPTQKVLYIAA